MTATHYLDQNGTMLAHPSKQGDDISKDKTYRDIPSSKDGIKVGKDTVIAYQTVGGTGWKSVRNSTRRS